MRSGGTWCPLLLCSPADSSLFHPARSEAIFKVRKADPGVSAQNPAPGNQRGGGRTGHSHALRQSEKTSPSTLPRPPTPLPTRSARSAAGICMPDTLPCSPSSRCDCRAPSPPLPSTAAKHPPASSRVSAATGSPHPKSLQPASCKGGEFCRFLYGQLAAFPRCLSLGFCCHPCAWDLLETKSHPRDRYFCSKPHNRALFNKDCTPNKDGCCICL